MPHRAWDCIISLTGTGGTTFQLFVVGLKRRGVLPKVSKIDGKGG
jgi:hypothetical protein